MSKGKYYITTAILSVMRSLDNNYQIKVHIHYLLATK